MALDKDDNCYISGSTWYADSTKNILLARFDPDGQLLWKRLYDNPEKGEDIPVAMLCDREGNVWITGISKRANGNADIALIRFSPEGVPDLVRFQDGPSSLFDAPSCMTEDNAGNIIVAGYITTADSGLNAAVFSYSTQGALRWQHRFGTMQMDMINAIVTDDSCNVYLCGNTNAGQRSGDLFFQKIDSSGKVIYTNKYDGSLSMRDAALQIAMDDSVNIYVSGFINQGNDRADVPVLKYNRNGVLLQEIVYYGGVSDCSASYLAATDAFVYLSGKELNYALGTNANFHVKYNKAGKQLLTQKFAEDIQIDKIIRLNKEDLLLGKRRVQPENTLVPYLAGIDDKGESVWEFQDDTIYGLSAIRKVQIEGDKIYFLGDDTGSATGSITISCYSFKQLK